MPAARVTGTVEVGGRRVELDGWPGMVGHNWGRSTPSAGSGCTASRFDGRARRVARPRARPRQGRARRRRRGSPTARCTLDGQRRASAACARAGRSTRRPGARRAGLGDVRIRVSRRASRRSPGSTPTRRRRAPRRQLLGRRARGRRGGRTLTPRTAASTSSGCGSTTTACPCSVPGPVIAVDGFETARLRAEPLGHAPS